MKKAEESKKALKFSPVKRKPSELKRYHEEIEIPNWAVIDESEVEFGYSQCPQEAEPAPLVTIAECKTKKDKSSATVVVFINCDTRPSVLVQLPYLEEPLMKKDVMANDDSDSIKLSLWGKKIEEAKSNGSYKLENVVIRKTQSFQGKVTYYLTTNTTTKIALSEIQVEGSNTIIDELKSYKVKLPAVNVHQITKKYRCQNCKVFKKSISEKRDLFECETCGKMKMEKDLKQSLETRLDFNSEEGKRVTVALYGPQILEYFRHWKTKVPENLKDIAIEFLRDEKTYLYYDNRNICIGFE